MNECYKKFEKLLDFYNFKKKFRKKDRNLKKIREFKILYYLWKCYKGKKK